MESTAGATLITEVGRDVLSKIAPEETPIFAAASKAYFADPAAALRQLRSKDNVLGFGLEAVAVAVTPVILVALSEMFEFLTRVAAKAVEDGLAKEIPDVISAMFRKFHSAKPQTPSVLTREHIGLIHGNVLQAARRLRLPPDKAQSLADAVTAQLVLAKE